jgi:hypothetical protein
MSRSGLFSFQRARTFRGVHVSGRLGADGVRHVTLESDLHRPITMRLRGVGRNVAGVCVDVPRVAGVLCESQRTRHTYVFAPSGDPAATSFPSGLKAVLPDSPSVNRCTCVPSSRLQTPVPSLTDSFPNPAGF